VPQLIPSSLRSSLQSLSGRTVSPIGRVDEVPSVLEDEHEETPRPVSPTPSKIANDSELRVQKEARNSCEPPVLRYSDAFGGSFEASARPSTRRTPEDYLLGDDDKSAKGVPTQSATGRAAPGVVHNNKFPTFTPTPRTQAKLPAAADSAAHKRPSGAFASLLQQKKDELRLSASFQAGSPRPATYRSSSTSVRSSLPAFRRSAPDYNRAFASPDADFKGSGRLASTSGSALLQNLGLSDDIRQALSKSVDLYDSRYEQRRRGARLSSTSPERNPVPNRTASGRTTTSARSLAPPPLLPSNGGHNFAGGVAKSSPDRTIKPLDPHGTARIQQSPGEISLADSCYIVSSAPPATGGGPDGLLLARTSLDSDSREEERQWLIEHDARELSRRAEGVGGEHLVSGQRMFQAVVDWDNFNSNDVIAQAFRFRQLQKRFFGLWQQWLWDCWKQEGVADAYFKKRVGKRALPRYWTMFTAAIVEAKHHRDRIDAFYTKICVKNYLKKYFQRLKNFMVFSHRVAEFSENSHLGLKRRVWRRWSRWREEERVRRSYRVLDVFYAWRDAFLRRKLGNLREEVAYLDAEVSEKVAAKAKGLSLEEIGRLVFGEEDGGYLFAGRSGDGGAGAGSGRPAGGAGLEQQAVSVIAKVLSAPPAVCRLLQGHASCSLMSTAARNPASAAGRRRSSAGRGGPATGRGGRLSPCSPPSSRRDQGAPRRHARSPATDHRSESTVAFGRTTSLPTPGTANGVGGAAVSPVEDGSSFPPLPRAPAPDGLVIPDPGVDGIKAFLPTSRAAIAKTGTRKLAKAKAGPASKPARKLPTASSSAKATGSGVSSAGIKAKSNSKGSRVGAALQGRRPGASPKTRAQTLHGDIGVLRRVKIGSSATQPRRGKSASGARPSAASSRARSNMQTPVEDQHPSSPISRHRTQSAGSLVVDDYYAGGSEAPSASFSPSRSEARYQYHFVEGNVPAHQRSTASTRRNAVASPGNLSARSTRSLTRSVTPTSARSRTPRSARGRGFFPPAAFAPREDGAPSVLTMSRLPSATDSDGIDAPGTEHTLTVDECYEAPASPPSRPSAGKHQKSSTVMYAAQYLQRTRSARSRSAGRNLPWASTARDNGGRPRTRSADEHVRHDVRFSSSRGDPQHQMSDDDVVLVSDPEHEGSTDRRGSGEGLKRRQRENNVSSSLYAQKYLHVAAGLRSASFFKKHPLLSSSQASHIRAEGRTMQPCSSVIDAGASYRHPRPLAETQPDEQQGDNPVFVPDGGILYGLLKSAGGEVWNRRCNQAYAYWKCWRRMTAPQRRVFAPSLRCGVRLQAAFFNWRNASQVVKRIRLVTAEIERFRKAHWFRLLVHKRIPFCIGERAKEARTKERMQSFVRAKTIRQWREFCENKRSQAINEEKTALLARRFFLRRWFSETVEQKRLKVLALHCATEIRYRHLERRVFFQWRSYWAFWKTGVGIALAKASLLRKTRFLHRWARNVVFLKQRQGEFFELQHAKARKLQQKAFAGLRMCTFGKLAVGCVKFEEQLFAAWTWLRKYSHAFPHCCVPHQIAYKNEYYSCETQRSAFSAVLGRGVASKTGAMLHLVGEDSSVFDSWDTTTTTGPGEENKPLALPLPSAAAAVDRSLATSFDASPVAQLASHAQRRPPKHTASAGPANARSRPPANKSKPPPGRSTVSAGGLNTQKLQLLEHLQLGTTGMLVAGSGKNRMQYAGKHTVAETAKVAKPLISLFQAPFATHPHRFRKFLPQTLTVFRCALLRKMLKSWRQRARLEKIFRLKMRFNCIWGVFVAYRGFCRKRRRERQVSAELRARTTFWTMDRCFRKWHRKFWNYDDFRRNFAAFRISGIQKRRTKFFAAWKGQIKMEATVRTALVRFLATRNYLLLHKAFSVLKQDRAFAQRISILEDVSALHFYKTHGTKALTAWRQCFLRSQIVLCFTQVREKRLLVRSFALLRDEAVFEKKRKAAIVALVEEQRLVNLQFAFRSFRAIVYRVKRLRFLRAQRELTWDRERRENAFRALAEWRVVQKYLREKIVQADLFLTKKRKEKAVLGFVKYCGLHKALEFFVGTLERTSKRHGFAQLLLWNREKLLSDINVFSKLLGFKLAKILKQWGRLAKIGATQKKAAPVLFRYRLRAAFATFAYSTFSGLAVRRKREKITRKLVQAAFFHWRWGLKRDKFFTRAIERIGHAMSRRLAIRTWRAWKREVQVGKRNRFIGSEVAFRCDARRIFDSFRSWAANVCQIKAFEELKLRRQTKTGVKILHFWYKFAMVEKCITVSANILKQVRLRNFLRAHLSAWECAYRKRESFRTNLQSFRDRRRGVFLGKAFYGWRGEKRRREGLTAGILALQKRKLDRVLRGGFFDWVAVFVLEREERAALVRLASSLTRMELRRRFGWFRCQVGRQRIAEQKRDNVIAFVQKRIFRPTFKRWVAFLDGVKLEQKQLKLAAAFHAHRTLQRTLCAAWKLKFVEQRKETRRKLAVFARKRDAGLQARLLFWWRAAANEGKREKQLEKLAWIFDKSRVLKKATTHWRRQKNGPSKLARMYEARILQNWDGVLQLFDYAAVVQELFSSADATEAGAAPRRQSSGKASGPSSSLGHSPPLLTASRLSPLRVRSTVAQLSSTSLRLEPDNEQQHDVQMQEKTPPLLWKPTARLERAVVLYRLFRSMRLLHAAISEWRSRAATVKSHICKRHKRAAARLQEVAFADWRFQVAHMKEARVQIQGSVRRRVLHSRVTRWKRAWVQSMELEKRRLALTGRTVFRRAYNALKVWKKTVAQNKHLRAAYGIKTTSCTHRRTLQILGNCPRLLDLWHQVAAQAKRARAGRERHCDYVQDLYFRKWHHVLYADQKASLLSLSMRQSRAKRLLHRWRLVYLLNLVQSKRVPAVDLAIPVAALSRTPSRAVEVEDGAEIITRDCYHLSGWGLQKTVLQKWRGLVLLRASEQKLVAQFALFRLSRRLASNFDAWRSTYEVVQRHKAVLGDCVRGRSEGFGVVLRRKCFTGWGGEVAFRKRCVASGAHLQLYKQFAALRKWRRCVLRKKALLDVGARIRSSRRSKSQLKVFTAMRQLSGCVRWRQLKLLQISVNLLKHNVKVRAADRAFLRRKGFGIWKKHTQYVGHILGGVKLLTLRRIARLKCEAFGALKAECLEKPGARKQAADRFHLTSHGGKSRTCFLMWRRICFGQKFANLLTRKLDSSLQKTYQEAFVGGLLQDFRELQARADRMVLSTATKADQSLNGGDNCDSSKQTTTLPGDAGTTDEELMSSVVPAREAVSHETVHASDTADEGTEKVAGPPEAEAATQPVLNPSGSTASTTTKLGIDIVQQLSDNLVHFRPRVLAEYVQQWRGFALHQSRRSKAVGFHAARICRAVVDEWKGHCIEENQNALARAHFAHRMLFTLQEAAVLTRGLREKTNFLCKKRSMQFWSTLARKNARQRALAFRARRWRESRLQKKFFSDHWLKCYHAPRIAFLKVNEVPAFVQKQKMRTLRNFFAAWRTEAAEVAPAIKKQRRKFVFRAWRKWQVGFTTRRCLLEERRESDGVRFFFRKWFLVCGSLGGRLSKMFQQWKLIAHEKRLLRATRGDVSKLRAELLTSVTLQARDHEGSSLQAHDPSVPRPRPRAAASQPVRETDRQQDLQDDETDRLLSRSFNSSVAGAQSLRSSLDGEDYSYLRDSRDSDLWSPRALRKARLAPTQSHASAGAGESVKNVSVVRRSPNKSLSSSSSRPVIVKKKSPSPTPDRGTSGGAKKEQGVADGVGGQSATPFQLPRFSGFSSTPQIRKIQAPTLGPLPANLFGGATGGGAGGK